MTRYAVPLSELDAVHVPVEQQVESQPVESAVPPPDPEDVDRIQLLANPSSAGRVRLR